MDFSEIKLTPEFEFNQSLANQLVDAITKGGDGRQPIYCALFSHSTNYCLFSPLWLFQNTNWPAHFEIFKSNSNKDPCKGKWYLQLHFEYKKTLNIDKLLEQYNAYDAVKRAAEHIHSEVLRQHLVNKLPVGTQPELYEWRDWQDRTDACLTFHPQKSLDTMSEALQLIPQFHQLIVDKLRQDTPPILQEMVRNIES